MSVESLARQLGARIAGLAEQVAVAAQIRQATVVTYTAGPPRRISVSADGGTIDDVPLLAHHAAPNAGDSVWIMRTGTGAWLYHGKQG